MCNNYIKTEASELKYTAIRTLCYKQCGVCVYSGVSDSLQLQGL